MMKLNVMPLGLLLAACVLAAPLQAQTGKKLPQAAIEVARSESVMSMRVDGELLIGPEGEVREYKITTEVPAGIKAMIDKSIAGWRFKPITDEAGKPVLARTFMRITLIAREGAGDDYTVTMENVRFHDGKKPDYRGAAREKGIDVVTTARPKYPALMLANNVNGSALVQLLFDAEGKVEDAIIVQSAMFNVRGHSDVLAQAVAEMEKESLRAVRRMRVKLGPQVDLADPRARSGYLAINYWMEGKRNDSDDLRQPGKWRQEQRGPYRAAVWLGDAARVGISDVDGTENLMSGEKSPIKPLSGVPTL